MEKGYVHFYTGTGKGKSTAAIGLAIRAVGAGKKVYLGQFVKDMAYHEIGLIKERIPEIFTETLGKGCFIDRSPNEEDRKAALDGLERAVSMMCSGKYDVVIFDEITIAIFCKLLTPDEVIEAIRKKPENVELILTGRTFTQELVPYCDLVTDMQEVKHYYQQGVLSRPGIDC